ncbi:MAG: PorT family protein [Muribaculaceae bacterium]|nr:PorT family protein [Muribaculaceae bacterium]
MKKFLILSIILLSVFGAAKAQFRYGPVVGVTLNSLVFKQDLVDVTQQVGYMAGIQGELMFPGIGVGIDLGLLYNQQGAMVKLGQKEIWASEGYGSERVYLHNIQIPVHLRFKYTRLNGIEDKIAPIVFGGPEFNIQVAHGRCDAFKYSGGDLGLTAGVGAELFRRWQVTGSYTWGMSYALKTKLLDDFSAQSRQWTVKVAYFF